jgi:hypothetical protein
VSGYRVIETPSGKFTLVYRNTREVRLHSGYDPDREAARAVEGFSAGRASIIAVHGIGLGYHLGHLKRRFPGKRIIAIEHDPEVAEISRRLYPSYLEDVPVITSIAGLSAVFEEMDIAGFRGIAHFIHRPSYILHEAFYETVMRDIGRYVSSKISDLLTRFEFEEGWVENILLNLPGLFTSARVRRLFGAFKGCPGVIVSAGPSLARNVDLLACMRERALIVSVDTAFRVLMRKKIMPHLVMSLDAQRYSIKHFLPPGGGAAALVADLVCCPAVPRSFQGRKIVSTTSKYYADGGGTLKRETTPLVGWIEKYAGAIGDIQSGGSVATSAFDLLLNLGCSPIILVGQDLAYTGREIHAAGTYHNDEWLPRINRFNNLDTINQAVIRRRKIKRVDAYGGRGEVVSDFVFGLYRSWLEDSARKVSVPVINATEGGARIRNTEEMTLADVLDRFAPLNPEPGTILDATLSDASRENPEPLALAMKDVLGTLGKITRLSAEALQTGNRVPEVEELVNREDIREIMAPYLRRARTYVSRRGVADGDAERILLKEISESSERLAAAIERSLGRIGKLLNAASGTAQG